MTPLTQAQQVLLTALCLLLSACVLPGTASLLQRTESRYSQIAAAYEGRALHHPPQLNWPMEDRLNDDKALTGALRARLTSALAHAKANTEASAMTAAISGPQGRWFQTIGHAEQAAPFYWASVGKTLTAIVILQMTEEGKLTLETPINRFIDGVPNGNIITIRHLMTHTSGLSSTSENSELQTQRRMLELDEELSLLRKRGALFCPGQFWRYSNSGYVLLGTVIETIDGVSDAQAVTDRLLAPLGIPKCTLSPKAVTMISSVCQPDSTCENSIQVRRARRET